MHRQGISATQNKSHFPTPPLVRYNPVLPRIGLGGRLAQDERGGECGKDGMEREAHRPSASVASGTKRLSRARRRNRPTSPPVATPMASANIRTIRRGRFGFFLSMEAEPSETSAGARRAAEQHAGRYATRTAGRRVGEANPIDVAGQWSRGEPPAPNRGPGSGVHSLPRPCHANALIRSFHTRIEGDVR
jgi:hypothetical protein